MLWLTECFQNKTFIGSNIFFKVCFLSIVKCNDTHITYFNDLNCVRKLIKKFLNERNQSYKNKLMLISLWVINISIKSLFLKKLKI